MKLMWRIGRWRNELLSPKSVIGSNWLILTIGQVIKKIMFYCKVITYLEVDRQYIF